jgi:hypothetical protein
LDRFGTMIAKGSRYHGHPPLRIRTGCTVVTAAVRVLRRIPVRNLAKGRVAASAVQRQDWLHQ